jgi:hypothetical protein
MVVADLADEPDGCYELERGTVIRLELPFNSRCLTLEDSYLLLDTPVATTGRIFFGGSYLQLIDRTDDTVKSRW